MKLEVQCKVGFPVPCGSAAFSHFPTVFQALFSMEWLHVQVGMEMKHQKAVHQYLEGQKPLNNLAQVPSPPPYRLGLRERLL